MSILDRTMQRFGFISQKKFEMRVTEAIKQELGNIQPWMAETADAQQWTLPDASIFANQADLYRLSPILGTAVEVLSNDLGTSRFSVKRMVGEEERDIPNHPFEQLLRNPNPLESGMELMNYTASNYKLNGNSVWWLMRSGWGEQPQEIWTIPFSQIQPVPDGRMYLSHYNYNPGNGKTPMRLEVWEIVHFKTYNPNHRFIGLSPIESLAVTIIGDLGMRRTNTTVYTEYGGAPQSILAFKDYVPNEQWNNIKNEKAEAAKRNAMMMLRGTGDGITWLSRQMSSKDMDFVNGLRQNMIDVFNRMCPGLLAMLDPNATEANALAARATYSEKTLWPMMETISQKITQEILPAYGRKLRGQFDDPRVVDRRLKLDEQTAYERSHTLAEVRTEFYGDDPIGDDRDKLFVSQINAQSGGIQEAAPSPFQRAADTDDKEDEAPAEDTGEDTGQKDMSAKAAIDALLKWRRQATRGKLERLATFTNPAIPGALTESIKAKLNIVTDVEAIKAVFDAAIDSLQPKPQVNPLVVLKSIEAGVRALELAAKG